MNSIRNTGRQNKNQAANAKNGHYARDCPKPKVHDARYFKEQMILAMKDEAGGTLNGEENDFMLDNAYGDDTLEELTATNVQKEAKNQQTINNERKRQQDLLQKELETCKEQVKTLEKKPIHFSKYQEACEELEREMMLTKTQLIGFYKKNIRFKANQFKQFICLGKNQTKFMIYFLQTRLGYQNLERLKKAIVAQPKMYDGERIQSTKLKIDSTDSEETLEDAEESRLKMKDKMIQLDYEKLNAL
nr:hypothetical protein [Tanacetum cinerariifolium]